MSGGPSMKIARSRMRGSDMSSVWPLCISIFVPSGAALTAEAIVGQLSEGTCHTTGSILLHLRAPGDSAPVVSMGTLQNVKIWPAPSRVCHSRQVEGTAWQNE